MNSYLKKFFTKKLTLQEMWQVYRLLKDGINPKSEKYLLHETIRILDGISTENFQQTLSVMGIPESKNSLDVVLLFTKSIKANNFFSFVQLISGITHGDR